MIKHIWVRSKFGPFHRSKIKIATCVYIFSERSGATFVVFSLLTTEDEELPCWNGLNEDTTVIPSWNIIEDIWVSPFFGLKVEVPNV
jgi:hypothetical protein